MILKRNSLEKFFSPSSKRIHSFTFPELLIILAIIGILISILLPNLLQTVKKTKQSVCSSNLRMISIALHSYTNDNRYFLPQHSNWGSMLGYETTFRGIKTGISERPLNVYLNNDTTIAVCPADNGDSYSPDDDSTSWKKVHENWGSSYLPQWKINNFATLHVTSNTKPPELFSFELPDKKLFTADWIWHMNRNLDDSRSHWHESNSRKCNTLFLDGRVSYFTFPNFLPRNTLPDPERFGWY